MLPLFLTSALGVQIQEAFGLTDSGFGAVVTMYHVSGVVLGMALGRYIDRIGWPRAVRLSGLVATLSLIGIATAARTAVVFAAMLIVGGVAHASAMASVNLAIVREIPLHRHAVVFGLKQAAPTGGFLVAGLSLPLVALTFGWRWTFAGAAALTFLAVGFVPTPARAPAMSQHAAGSRAHSQRGAIRMPATGFMAVAGAAAAMSVSALAAFLVIANVAAGVEPSAAGVLVAVCSVVGITVRVVAGAYTDKRGSNGLGLVAFLLLLGCLGYVALATGQRPLLFVGSLVAFGAGWGWPGLFHFAVVSINPEAPAAATGLTHAAVSFGSAVGPVGFGLIAEAGGYGWAWAAVAIVAGLAAGLILAARSVIARTSPMEAAAPSSARA